MMTPVVRMVATAMQDAVYGVIPQLDALELDDPNDARPVDPSILTTATDDAAVSPDSLGAGALIDLPCLVIACEIPARVVITGIVGQAFDVPNLTLTIPYVTDQTMDAVEGWRSADYTFRALVHALNRALFASDRETSRRRGKVTIVKYNSMEYGPADFQMKTGTLRGILKLDLHIRVQP